MTNTLDHPGDNNLGAFLRDRRTRLDPAAFGLPPGRRRTPGLRREEVAQRAAISPVWYAWLEQGRGGAPSAEVLDRIARALMLTEVEREHLFLCGLGRPPAARPTHQEGVTPRLQRVLDALSPSPALIKTALWDVIAWNRAAQAVLTDYAAVTPDNRNVLRLMFTSDHVRRAQSDWEHVARFVVGVFRAETARAGLQKEAAALAADLAAASPEFAAIWQDNDVHAYGGGIKHIRHHLLGEIALEFSAFAVDGRPDLGLIVYNTTSDQDAARIQGLIDASALK